MTAVATPPTQPTGSGPAAAPVATPTRRRPGVLPTVFMALLLSYALAPLLWLLFGLTKSNSGLFDSFGYWFASDVRPLQNLRELFAYEGGVFARWLANTVLYAVVSAVGAAVFASMGGYAFSKFDFRGKRVAYAVILASIMVPTTALALPTYLLFAQMRLVDTPLAIILPSLLNPLGIFLMKAYVDEAVPDSVIESARLDGAGEARIFWSIASRMLVPAFITVLLFALVGTWNNYFLPLIMLNTPDLFPVTVGLAQLNATANAGGGSQPLLNLVVTGSLVSVVLPIAAFLLLQRFWQSGLNAGGVKG